MSIKLRLLCLLGVLLIAFIASLLTLGRLERAQLGEILSASQKAGSHLMERWIEIDGDSLRQFAADYSQWDEMFNYARQPDPAWAAINITASLPNFNAQAAWVLRPDFGVVYSKFDDDPRPPLPWSPAELTEITRGNPFFHFFVDLHGQLLEIRGAPIQPSDDLQRRSEPAGWFVVGRRWDDRHLATIGSLAESRVHLSPAEAPAPLPSDRGIHLILPLNDWRGHSLRVLHLERDSPEIAEILEVDAFEARVFVIYGLLVIGLLALALHLWVLRPLRWIGESLAADTVAPIQPLLREKTELSRVARLVESSFTQKSELRREVDERAKAETALRRSESALRRSLEERVQLGRDLHDGVIQQIYAAGMGLTATRAALPPDAHEAAERIEYIRRALNETIRDLRNFITGLEPEALKNQTFSEAVSSLVDFFQAVNPVDFKLSVDEAAADQLSHLARADALQIIREAVSNSLRHGAARHVTIDFQARDARIRLEIADDGCGFDPGATSTGGRGLRNMRERAIAAEAEFQLQSSSAGTRVIVFFPPAGYHL